MLGPFIRRILIEERQTIPSDDGEVKPIGTVVRVIVVVRVDGLFECIWYHRESKMT